eukprot:gene13201-17689_t
MLFVIQLLLITFFIASGVLGTDSDVVILNSSNFEHLTQASTGATTGDWLVKFYAPWCGHCKTLAPVFEKVATELKGEINVAKIDVTANRDLGTRFEIKGFPTVKFFSKGKVYTFKGRRSEEEFIQFVRGGYQIHEPEEVHPPLGFLGEIEYVYRHAYKTAGKDLLAGRYFTMDVFVTFMPLLFIAILVLFCLLPSPENTYRAPPATNNFRNETSTFSANAAPPTSATDASKIATGKSD